MIPAPDPIQACHCHDNQQNSCSDTKKVGFGLGKPTYSLGQLDIAASKVGDPQHPHLAVNKSFMRKTRNDVYEEILQTVEVVSTPRYR